MSFQFLFIVQTFAFIAGTLSASFCFTVAIRLLKDESLWTRSHCDRCPAKVTWTGLIPVLGFLLNRGTCATCGQPIDRAYPLFELFVGVIFVALLDRAVSPTHFLFLSLYWSGLSVIALTDTLKKWIFFQPVLVLFCIRTIDLLIGESGRFLDSFLGMTVGAGSLYFVAYFYASLFRREGLGSGDITTAGLIGFIFGWQALFAVFFFSSILGGILVTLRYFVTGEAMNRPFPYAPALIGALWVRVFFPELERWVIMLMT